MSSRPDDRVLSNRAAGNFKAACALSARVRSPQRTPVGGTLKIPSKPTPPLATSFFSQGTISLLKTAVNAGVFVSLPKCLTDAGGMLDWQLPPINPATLVPAELLSIQARGGRRPEASSMIIV